MPYFPIESERDAVTPLSSRGMQARPNKGERENERVLCVLCVCFVCVLCVCALCVCFVLCVVCFVCVLCVCVMCSVYFVLYLCVNSNAAVIIHNKSFGRMRRRQSGVARGRGERRRGRGRERDFPSIKVKTSRCFHLQI